ncbi:MAG: hypothetical protein Q8L29_03470, partial [archaeon]|nr:hypothetical protein [archaeon]
MNKKGQIAIFILISIIILTASVLAVLDDDEDGIPNVGDKCDNSELGFVVDEVGCSCEQKMASDCEGSWCCNLTSKKCIDLCTPQEESISRIVEGESNALEGEATAVERTLGYFSLACYKLEQYRNSKGELKGKTIKDLEDF